MENALSVFNPEEFTSTLVKRLRKYLPKEVKSKLTYAVEETYSPVKLTCFRIELNLAEYGGIYRTFYEAEVEKLSYSESYTDVVCLEFFTNILSLLKLKDL